MVDDAELMEQAKRTLAAVMNDDKASSAAKVSAAKAAMALAGPGNAAAGGKKGAQAQAAKEAFARFATRPPPRLAVDNT